MSMENVAVVVGRVHTVNQQKGVYYHDVQLPAADEYAQPQWVTVRSDTQLASPGTELRGYCALKGWRRGFQKKDGTQGYQVASIFDYLRPLSSEK